MSDHELKPLVAAVIEGQDPGPLFKALSALDRENIHGQSAVRLLMNKNRWDFTPGSDSDGVMDHLFGHFEERKPQSSEDYLKATREIILELWGVDLENPKWHVADATKVPRPVKKTEVPASKVSRKKVTPVPIDGPADAARYGTLTRNDVDTKDASDRLKKVIKIQRGQ